MPSLLGRGAEYDPVSVRTLDQEPLDERTNDSPPGAKNENTPSPWGVGWRTPTIMVGFVICGAILSVGHHLYYRSLDNTAVKSLNEQTWAIRIGTGFAFLIKTFLVGAVGIAAVQEIWATVRRKSVKVRGIDGMFSVLSSPAAFLIPDLWMYAKTLTVLAIISWLIPLTAIVTPATLSVHLLTTTHITEIRVPTVNFTDLVWIPWAVFEGAGRIASPSPGISRLFAATSSSIAVLPISAPFPNSSHTLKFWGPSYKCERLADALVEMEGMTFPDDLDNHHYSLQDLWDQEIGKAANLTDMVYKGSSPDALNNTLFLYASGINPLWNLNPTQPTKLVCQLWNTSYVVDLHFTNGVQTLIPVSTDLVAPANWSSEAGSNVALEPQPDVNGGYYVTHMLFTGLIDSWLALGASGGLGGTQDNSGGFAISIIQSGLFSCPELWNSSIYGETGIGESESTTDCRNGTLARTLEDLSRNFTYSLLSLNAANTTVPVTVTSPQNFYSYNQKNLLSAYVTAVGVAILCVIVGLHALWENGVSQSTSFSSILRTTRNHELDRLAVGHCLGSDQLGEEISEVKLRFGEIEGAQPYKHAAFGLENSVTGLTKGECYY